MKILLLNCSYPPNRGAGAERVVQSLAEGLAERGHDAVVVTTHARRETTVDTLKGVRVHYLPLANLYPLFAETRPGPLRRSLWHLIDSCNPAMSRAVGSVLDAEKPDVLNSHNLVGFSPAVLTAVSRRAIPLVHTLHDQYLLCPKSTMFDGQRNCARRCLDCWVYSLPRQAFASRVDVVVGVSGFILKRHLEFGYFPDACKTVIYNGVESGAPENAATRADGRFRFGFLGQIRPAKGLHELIPAFLAECAAEAELWIAGHGDPDYEAGLQAGTAGAPNVRWLGFVKAAELLSAVDVLVVPSLWRDTAPLVVLEASAAGVPVLGSNRGGIPEFITAQTGWIYDADDPAALRRALRRCLESRARLPAMRQSARILAGEFNRARFVDRYLETFSAVRQRASDSQLAEHGGA